MGTDATRLEVDHIPAVHNNNVLSREFLVRMITTIDKCPSRETLIKYEKWFMDRLYTVSCTDGSFCQCQTEPCRCGWRVIFKHMDEFDDEGNLLDPEYPFEIRAHIHCEWNGSGVNWNNTVVISEIPTIPTLSPKKIGNTLAIDAPPYIKSIGVSGLSTSLASKWWWMAVTDCEECEMYDKSLLDASSEDRWGFRKGYMMHSMRFCYGDVREESFNFGWPKYPPPEPKPM